MLFYNVHSSELMSYVRQHRELTVHECDSSVLFKLRVAVKAWLYDTGLFNSVVEDAVSQESLLSMTTGTDPEVLGRMHASLGPAETLFGTCE